MALLAFAAVAGSANADVLFNQSVGASPDSITSQDREPENNEFDAEVADDFVVPAGKDWRIEEVFARGVRIGIGEATDAHVTLYSDNSGAPGNLILDELAAVKPTTYPRLELIIASKPVLQPGTYWLGVQPILNGLIPENDPPAVNQWFWADNPTVAGNPAVFRNPGNGFLTNCTAFSLKTTCVFPPPHGPNAAHEAADQFFRISGVEFLAEPDTSIDSGPAEGSTISSKSTSFSFSSSEPEATFSCSLDGGTFSSCTSPKAVSGLTDGPHSFSVRVTNGVGTVDPTPATRQFTVKAPPSGPSKACIAARAGKKKAVGKLNKARKEARKAKGAKARKAAKRNLSKAKSNVGKASKKVKSAC